MNEGVRGPEPTVEVVERMQQEPVHQAGDRNAGQGIEPGHPPARTVSIGPNGQAERRRYHQQVRLSGEVAEEPPYPDGMRWLNATGIGPGAPPIPDELEAQGKGRHRQRPAGTKPEDS